MMATIVGNLKFKTIGETVPGELFRLNCRGGFALCVTLMSGNSHNGHSQQGNPLIGLLKSHLEPKPLHVDWSDDAECASYGRKWILEPLWGDESTPHNREAKDAPQLLWANDTSAVLTFYPMRKDSLDDELYGDIINGGLPASCIEDRMPVRHWRIWASEADRNRPGAKPVVEFGAD